MDQMIGQNLDAETIREYERKHVLTPWTPQKGLKPLVVDRAKGNYFFDSEGKRYLDFTSQFVFSTWARRPASGLGHLSTGRKC